MLFNSLEFIFVFLPITFAVTFVLLRRGRNEAAILFLTLASLAFYSWWNPRHLWLLLFSLLANYWLSGVLVTTPSPARRRLVLGSAVAFNLTLLGYFKYLSFFADIAGITGNAASDVSFVAALAAGELPLGISFYTFLQIAYLVDCSASCRQRPYSLVHYGFFVSFFPHLIAGPLIHHRTFMPQLAHLSQRLRGRRYAVCFLAPGIALFIVGLAKKVLLADSFAGYADQAFAPSAMADLGFLDAWGGTLAYTLQIYFDFSGYSDMAIGLALLFGLSLPDNFLSPYKATSFSDFWRRWHITLSHFLRDYLYIPLGGNRRGPTRQSFNLMITMTLGGLWHGASWNFVLWGGLHGILLLLNHGWRAFSPWRPPGWMAVAIVFPAIMLSWVPFRAHGLDDTLTVWSVMFGARGIVLPDSYRPLVAALGEMAPLLGIATGTVRYFAGMQQIVALAAGLAIVFCLPNSMSLRNPRRFHATMRSPVFPLLLGVIAAAAVAAVVVRIDTPFLYFQF